MQQPLSAKASVPTPLNANIGASSLVLRSPTPGYPLNRIGNFSYSITSYPNRLLEP